MDLSGQFQWTNLQLDWTSDCTTFVWTGPHTGPPYIPNFLVPVSKQINLAIIRMFGNWRLFFKLDPDTPSINKCTGEIDVMEALVEMIYNGL